MTNTDCHRLAQLNWVLYHLRINPQHLWYSDIEDILRRLQQL